MTVWHLYLLQNQAGMMYAGISTDPHRRVRQHNGELKGGAKALRGKGPFQLIFQYACVDKSHALSLEHQLKRQRKANKCQWFSQLAANTTAPLAVGPADVPAPSV